MAEENLHEAFMRLNANPEFIYSRFGDVLRNLIRAVGSTDYPYSALDRATKEMQFIFDLIKRCESDISIFDMFSAGVEEIRMSEKTGELRGAIIAAARSGMSVVVEASSSDGFAGARLAKRTTEFLQMIEWVNKERAPSRGGSR